MHKNFLRAGLIILSASLIVSLLVLVKLNISFSQNTLRATAGGPWCSGICSCSINGCKYNGSLPSGNVQMIRYHCDKVTGAGQGCAGPEVERKYTTSMTFQENCGSEQIDAYEVGTGNTGTGWAHINYANDCGSTPKPNTPTPTPTLTPTPTPTLTPTPTPTLTPTPTPTATPTETPTPTPTGTPNSCGGTCGSNYNCQGGLFCYNGYCRNPYCESDTSCNCVSTPTPTPTPTTPPVLPKTGADIWQIAGGLLLALGSALYVYRKFKLV